MQHSLKQRPWPAWALLTTFLPRASRALTRSNSAAYTARTTPNRRRASTRAAFARPAATGASERRNGDTHGVCVVVGASRGIGLALVQQLASRWRGRIVATCRDREAAGALEALWQFMPARFRVLEMDVTEEAAVRAAAAEVRGWTEGRVDLLVHCAGVLHEGDCMPETALAQVDVGFLKRNLEVNTIGPILVAKHFSPMMTTARKKDRETSILATLSARVGSISDNGLGGWVSYRASKAAQNQAMRTASVELGRRGVIVVSLHPGTVATDLSMPFRRGVPEGKLFEVDYAAGCLLDVIDSLDVEDNGSFLAYDRSVIPF